jgi:hypothetical protein
MNNNPIFNPLRYLGFSHFIENYFRNHEFQLLQFADFIADVNNEAWEMVEKNPSMTIGELEIWLTDNIPRLKTEFFKNEK